MQLFYQGAISQKSCLKNIVVSSHSLKSETIATLFAEVKTKMDVTKALEDTRKISFCETEDRGNTRSISKAINPYIDYCFAPRNKETIIKAISFMEINIHKYTYD